jgi:hypothetical protein
MQYRSLMWRTFFCAILAAGVFTAGLSIWLTCNQTISLAYGLIIASVPHAWAVARAFRLQQGRVQPQAAIMAAWVKLGLCAVGFAWVFNLPNIEAGAVFAGFIMQTVLITAGNSWVAMLTQKR